MLLQELQHIERKLEDKPDSILEDRVAAIEYAIKGLENGIEKPFLSLIGFTTPVTFDNLVDYGSATNGFFARAFIFVEHETVPTAKVGFRKAPMSECFQLSLKCLVEQLVQDCIQFGYHEFFLLLCSQLKYQFLQFGNLPLHLY